MLTHRSGSWSPKEPPSAQQADSTVKERTTAEASQWSEREDSNLQPPASEAGALPLRHVQVWFVLTVGFEPTLTAV